MQTHTIAYQPTLPPSKDFADLTRCFGACADSLSQFEKRLVVRILHNPSLLTTAWELVPSVAVYAVRLLAVVAIESILNAGIDLKLSDEELISTGFVNL